MQRLEEFVGGWHYLEELGLVNIGPSRCRGGLVRLSSLRARTPARARAGHLTCRAAAAAAAGGGGAVPSQSAYTPAALPVWRASSRTPAPSSSDAGLPSQQLLALGVVAALVAASRHRLVGACRRLGGRTGTAE